MSAQFSVVSHFSFALRGKELTASFLAWGAYMGGLTCYCVIYQSVVSAAVPDVSGSILYILREWGIWLFITPVVFGALRRNEGSARGGIRPYVQLGVVVLLASLTFIVTMDMLAQQRGLAPTIVIYLPRYFLAFVFIIFIWRVFLSSRPLRSTNVRDTETRDANVETPAVLEAAPPSREIKSDAKPNDPPRTYPETLLVSKGSDECLIRIDRVASITAAGNYVEIFGGNQLYLLRATMKQVEGLLPPSAFVRIHRSHIVNVNEIERIKTQRSGNGTVHLRCGKILSMSKKYKAHLQRLGCKRLPHPPACTHPREREGQSLHRFPHDPSL